MHRFDAGGGKWFRHIADSATDETLCRLWVGFVEGRDATPDFGKKVAGLEFEEIVVNACHVA